MDRETRRQLEAVYFGKHTHTEYDEDIRQVRHLRPSTMDKGVWRELCAGPYPPNDFQRLEHDAAVERVVAADRAIPWDAVLDAFVLAVSGRWLRGSQSVISAAYARHLAAHPFHNPDAATNPHFVCHVCGLKREEWVDRTRTRLTFHRGQVWNEFPTRYVFDLEEWPQLSPPAVERADREALLRLLSAIDRASPDETPGDLSKRLAKSALPRMNKYRRYGLLSALAELGVMPNERVDGSYDRLVPRPEMWAVSLPGSARSDIPLPLAAWRGADGVAWDRAETLFHVNLTGLPRQEATRRAMSRSRRS